MSESMQTAHQPAEVRTNWQDWLLGKFRLSRQPRVKLYYGYGHEGKLTIFGHVLRLTPFPREKYRKGIIRNTAALLRLFLVKPMADVKLVLEWKGVQHRATSDQDGFFRFDWDDHAPYHTGWHEVKVIATRDGKMFAAEKGHIHIPQSSQYIFISDIDDTFLISHSKNMRKRLFVLFTNNARSRQPFEGVVRHYQLLQKSNTGEAQYNPFFYVSSSEWNLFDYLVEFTHKNQLPKGVFLLSQLKSFSELLKTGQHNHHTKFARIVRIMEAFPHHRVVLLGDSSQQDPFIYQAIVKHFPKQVHAVYIRDIYNKSRTDVAGVLQQIESSGVPCCFFAHSSEAILHSIKIGLIPAEEGRHVPVTD